MLSTFSSSVGFLCVSSCLPPVAVAAVAPHYLLDASRFVPLTSFQLRMSALSASARTCLQVTNAIPAVCAHARCLSPAVPYLLIGVICCLMSKFAYGICASTISMSTFASTTTSTCTLSSTSTCCSYCTVLHLILHLGLCSCLCLCFAFAGTFTFTCTLFLWPQQRHSTSPLLLQPAYLILTAWCWCGLSSIPTDTHTSTQIVSRRAMGHKIGLLACTSSRATRPV